MSQLFKMSYGKKRSLRLVDVDYSTPHVYHVIIATMDRGPVFKSKKNAGTLIDVFFQQALKCEYTIFAFCVMPDHFHLLCQPNGSIALSAFIGRIKSITARLIGGKAFWQKSFYDHILRKEEDVLELAYYIAGNPARKNMVKDWREYPFSFIMNEKDIFM